MPMSNNTESAPSKPEAKAQAFGLELIPISDPTECVS
ncbi:MAG: hypothetical protein N4J56_006138 [Chroococcidiopsis sp. SAG 2025]|nr:hypothetical protein [Chroococcidiopsis sp. SAG 2025]